MTRQSRPRFVFLADLEDYSARELCLGAAEYAARENLRFEPWTISQRHSGKPSDFTGVDGMLLTQTACGAVFGDKPRIKVPHIFLLDGPFATADSPSVELDEVAVGRMAAEHLAHRGYRHLVSMTSSLLPWGPMRSEGFRREAERLGLPVRHIQMQEEELPAYWHHQSLRENKRLQEVLSSLPKPCGIFAINDVAACFIIEAARVCRIKVPHEIGVVGADNDLIPNAAAGLSISSVEPPFKLVGEQAAAILHQKRMGKAVARKTILPPVRVIVRTSTDAFMVDDPLVRRAQAYIETNRGRDLRVSEVARNAGSSTVTLGKHFQRYLNTTPSEYILRSRIEAAKELLREGKLNVEEVSASCGFHSASYFCQVFRQVTFATPGSFRP
jgi:LacI family transcriptional regulator